MDPKLSGLDPKLQEAYNRVMNGPSTAPQPQPQNPAPAAPVGLPPSPPPLAQTPPSLDPVQAAPPPAQVQTAPDPAQPPSSPPAYAQQTAPVEAAPPPPAYPAGTIPGVNSTVAFNANDNQKNQGTTMVKSGGHHLMPIFVGVAIMFLLVAYTFVWIIIFNVKVPFLPQL